MTDKAFHTLRVTMLILTSILLISTVSAYDQTPLSLIENITVTSFGGNDTCEVIIPSQTLSVSLTGDQTLTGVINVPSYNATVSVPPLQVISNPVGGDIYIMLLIIIAFCNAVTVLITSIMFMGWLKNQVIMRRTEV